MCRPSSACRALSPCVAADRVVLMAAASSGQQTGADVWSEPTRGQPTVLQTLPRTPLTSANATGTPGLRTYLTHDGFCQERLRVYMKPCSSSRSGCPAVTAGAPGVADTPTAGSGEDTDTSTCMPIYGSGGGIGAERARRLRYSMLRGPQLDRVTIDVGYTHPRLETGSCRYAALPESESLRFNLAFATSSLTR